MCLHVCVFVKENINKYVDVCLWRRMRAADLLERNMTGLACQVAYASIRRDSIFFRASLQLSLAEQHAEYIGPSLVLDMHSAHLTASTQARLPQE